MGVLNQQERFFNFAHIFFLCIKQKSVILFNSSFYKHNACKHTEPHFCCYAKHIAQPDHESFTVLFWLSHHGNLMIQLCRLLFQYKITVLALMGKNNSLYDRVKFN